MVGGVGALLVPVVVSQLGWPAALGSASIFAVVAALLWLGVDADPPTSVIRRSPGSTTPPEPPRGQESERSTTEVGSLLSPLL